MSQLQDRIAAFQKMAADDPDNELGHFRLGQLHAEAGDHAAAARAFERTLEIQPTFSKALQLLGEAHIKLGAKEKAVEVLTNGWKVADERGDKMPRDAMGKLLKDLGAPVPQAAAPEFDGPETGFKCERPGCMAGRKARPLPAPPILGPVGDRIAEGICVDCWNGWFKDYSIKVVNELRLDLSTEFGQAEYDKHLREYLGFEEPAAG